MRALSHRVGTCVLAMAALVGCSSSSDDEPGAIVETDAGADRTVDAPHESHPYDAAPEHPFAEAPHPLPPEIPKHTGAVLASTKLVSIYWQGDGDMATIEQFNDAVVASDWWKTVGDGYGVGPASHVATYVIPAAAPTTVTDGSARQTIADLIGAGSVPPPDGDSLYALFLPPGTALALAGYQGCVDVGGYHSESFVTSDGGKTKFAYAVLPRCGGFGGGFGLGALTVAASHEFIEAATDPFPYTSPGYFFDQGDAWSANLGEVADLCNGGTVTLGEFVVTRSWSIAAAAKGEDPCQPPHLAYFGAALDPDTQTAQTGGTVDFTVRAFSTIPLSSPMHVQASTGFAGTAGLGFSIDDAELDNGDVTTLHVAVPDTFGPGSYPFQLDASRGGGNTHFWGGAVVVPE